MEVELNEEKSIDSFQAEMDLVKEEEETENRLSQKDRLELILSKIKNQNNEENEESPKENNQILRGNPNILRATQKKVESQTIIPEPFDSNFKLNQRYFYQNININEWNDINQFIEEFINSDMKETDLENFFESHQKISKGNILQLQNMIDKIFEEKKNLEKYKLIINFIIKKYFKPKPVICECYFFPNPSNEQRVVNMFRTCKKSLDLAIFTFTRDSIAQAVLEAYQRGVKVRCIGDDGNSKVKGSDVRLLASIGIPCKTDNNLRFHMHNKMAILDNSVVITGSFNWTSQAVNKNQDNILFIEDKNIAQQYTDYYNKMWESFDTIITQEEAKKYLENEKKAEQEKRAEKEKQEKINTKETSKKDTTKKDTTKKDTTKKETNKKETGKKETSEKKTSKKENIKKEKNEKTSIKKETKKEDTKKSKSKTESKDKKESSKIKKDSSKQKETKKETKKNTKSKNEINKKSKSVSKEKTKAKKSQAQGSKPKTVKEKKKEKNDKKKPATTKRVRGVKANKKK